MPVCALLGAFATPACSNHLEDVFCDPNCPAVTDDSLLLPIRPDAEVVDDCAACSAVACAEERASCLEDGACTRDLRCLDACSDQGCLDACRGQAGRDGLSPFVNDLLICTAQSCSVQCRTGANWECVQAFDWPKREVQSIKERVRFGTSFRSVGLGAVSSRVALMGATIRTCDLISGCVARTATLDASNGADLELPTGTADSTFRGFFDIDSDEAGWFGAHYRVYFAPLSGDGLAEMPLITDLYPAGVLGWHPSPESASLWAYAGDCAYTPANVHFEIVGRPEVPVAHLRLTGLSFEASDSGIGAAFFPELTVTPLPGGSNEVVTLQAVVPDEAGAGGLRVVARREVALSAGRELVVYLPPLSRTD
jgi:hypothetical protein